MIQEYDIANKRLIPFSQETVYEAFRNPELLKQRWGPEGFTNTFDTFQFQEGGDWIFTMIGPDDKEYPNISKFIDIKQDYIHLEHINNPHFFLHISFITLGANKTEIQRRMKFVDTQMNEELREFLHTANEQNFDRLEQILKNTNTL